MSQKNSTKLAVPDDTVASANTHNTDIHNQEQRDAVPVVPSPATEGEAAKSTSQAGSTGTTQKKRRKKQYREMLVDASEVMPKPSFWPLLLAFSIAFTLFGLIWNAVFLFIGIALIVACIIGWTREKRDRSFKTAVPVSRNSKDTATTDAGAVEERDAATR